MDTVEIQWKHYRRTMEVVTDWDIFCQHARLHPFQFHGGSSTHHSRSSQLAHVFVAALKSGFAGSLSTVSTFVVESVALLQSLPQHAFGYYYSVGTIVSAALLGIICYAWAA